MPNRFYGEGELSRDEARSLKSLRKQMGLNGIIICTSTTRPAIPFDGMVIYETDTQETLTYYASASVWRRSWRMPWGVVGTAVVSADQTGITAEVDLTGFTATFTAVANRMYLVEYSLGITQNTTPGAQVYTLFEGASNIGILHRENPVPASELRMVTGSRHVTSLAAGSRTLKLKGTTSAGTLSIVSGSLVNGRWIVSDIGPNGAPA